MGIFEFLLVVAAVVLGIIFLVLIFTKKGRMFAKAVINSLFTEANKNPKVVAEYFDEKIARLQDSYRKADDAYRKAAGEKISNEKKIKMLEKELEKLNGFIVSSRKHGNIDDARMYAEEALAVKGELEVRQNNVPVFEEAMKSREDIRNRAKSAISQVERRKREDMAKAEAGKAAQEIYSQFDESRISTDIDRVLNQFSDYADEQEKMGMGAKASWETSYEAKKIAAEKRENEYLTDEYIESLLGNGTSK